jgi:hypothetical protein
MVNLAPAIKPSYFFSTFVFHLISWLIKICLLGIPCLHLSKILLMLAAFRVTRSGDLLPKRRQNEISGHFLATKRRFSDFVKIEFFMLIDVYFVHIKRKKNQN